MPKSSHLNRNAVKNTHLRYSKFRETPSRLGVQAEGVAGFTAAALYRGVADHVCIFSATTAMPLGHFCKNQRDRKISFGNISSFINCHREAVCAAAISQLMADCFALAGLARVPDALVQAMTQKLLITI